MDYGGLNRLIGREVGEEFWGTRTQHIVGVAAALALTGKSAFVCMNSTTWLFYLTVVRLYLLPLLVYHMY